MSARGVRVSAVGVGLVLLLSVLVYPAAPLQAAPMGNGKIAYVAPDNSIRTVNPDGTGDAQLVAPRPAPFNPEMVILNWSPDGSTLAWSRLEAETLNNVVEAVDADGTDLRTLAVLGNDIANGGEVFVVDEVEWSPDGSRLLVGGQDIAYQNGSRHIVVEADGSGSALLAAPPSGSTDSLHVWSPTGTRLAFSRRTYDPVSRTERSDLAVANADGTAAVVIASLGGLTWIDPGAWTGDDRILARVRNATPTSTVWTIRPDGSGALQIATVPTAITSRPELSPDGSTVMVQGTPGGLFRFPLAGGAVTTIDVPCLPYPYPPAWSPDGAFILVNSCNEPLAGIVTMRPDGSDAAVVVHSLVPAAWQPVPVQADRWRVNVSGGIAYSADAPVAGNLEVAKDSSGVRQVYGSGTYSGTGGSTATVSASVNRFWILPIYVGSVRVADPGASLSLNHVVFFSRVDATATGSTSTQSWIDTSTWPWRSYSMTWQIDDTT